MKCARFYNRVKKIKVREKDMEKQPTIHAEKIRTREKFAYGCGDLASNLVLVLSGTYITFFYTDALGLNVGIVGMIVMLSRLFDGITDVIMGFVIDKTKSKYGKARPWMLWLAIPFGLAAILLMTVPMSWGDIGKYIYVFITYNLCTTFLYTAINIPYGALNSLMTRDQHQRESINVWRMTMAQIGALIINACTLPLVNAVGGSSNQKSWIIVATIYGAMAAALFLICFFNTEERVHAADDKSRQLSIGQTIKLLSKNTYWLLICLLWVTMALGLGMGMSVGTYYCKYILKNENLFGILSVVQTVVMLICMPMMVKPIAKYGKRNVASIGSIAFAAGYGLALIAPTSVPWLLVCSAVKGIGYSTLGSTIFAMVADTIEYGQWKTGIRVEGPLYSATTFGAKVGAGVGMAIASAILGAAGYNGMLAIQSQSALSAIFALFIIVPVFFVLALPVILHFYKLDKEYSQVMADLAERESK